MGDVGTTSEQMSLMRDAYRMAAVGDAEAIRKQLSRSSGPSRALLRATLQQYEGDVDGAVRVLRSEVARTRGEIRAMLGDALAPILVMRRNPLEVLRLADALEAADWHASAYAFRALASAHEGDRLAASRHVSRSERALDEVDDDVVRFRVLQRLALVAYRVANFEKALELAATSAQVCADLGAWRAAIGGYSVAYAIHRVVTGDAGQALAYARLWLEAAKRAKDESFVHAALVANFEAAVQFADLDLIVRYRTVLRRRLIPQQYSERFSYAFSHALATGADDLVAMRTLLEVLRDDPSRTRGESALCSGLIATAAAAAFDDVAARSSARDAITRLGRAQARDTAVEFYYRRLARVSAAAASTLVGDHVRSARILEADDMSNVTGARELSTWIYSGDWSRFDPSLKGMARVFHRATEARTLHLPPGDLTVAEFEILRLIARGWGARRIADETERSIHTVRNHTRAVLGKLGASRALEAVAMARDRGWSI